MFLEVDALRFLVYARCKTTNKELQRQLTDPLLIRCSYKLVDKVLNAFISITLIKSLVHVDLVKAT